jgi:hypothetical protein
MPANAYPLVTIIEFPGRFLALPTDCSVKLDEAEEWVKNGTKRKREELWKMLEEHMGKSTVKGSSPFLVGAPTILDVVVYVVAHWGPGWPEDPARR